MLLATESYARQAALCYALASVYLSLGELRLAVEALESSLVLRRKGRCVACACVGVRVGVGHAHVHVFRLEYSHYCVFRSRRADRF